MSEFFTFDAVVVEINTVLSFFAALVHLWAGWKTSHSLRYLFWTIAALAFFYSMAYWWLLWNLDRAEVWSRIVRPAGIASWLIAWSLEPIIMVLWLQRRAKEIEARGKQALDEVAEKHGIDLDG